MFPTPRQSRISEYLENIKQEFETLAHDVNMFKIQRDDYERKLQAQLNELNNLQQTFYDLERNHNKIKQQYEDEILRLRRQLELQGNSNSNNGLVNAASSLSSNIIVNSSSNRNTITTSGNSSIEKVPNVGGMMNNGTNSSNFYPGLAPIDNKRSFSNSSNIISPIISGTKRSLVETNPSESFHPSSYGSFPPISSINENNSFKYKRDSDEKIIKEEKKAEDITKSKKEESQDWIVGYNPNAQTSLNVDLLHTLEHSSVVCCVKFSFDGKYLATGCNKSAQIYDVESGEKIHTFSEDISKEGDLYIRSVCFSPNGKYLAAGAEDKTVKIWDIENKRLHNTFIGHELDIYSLDFSKDGNFIVSGSGDKKAKIWDVEKGECIHTLGNDEVGPKDGITSVAFSPDGKYVAAGSLDRVVRIWDAITGYFVERYEGHLDSVYSVSFSPDGKLLASGSLDKTLKIWDLSNSRSRSKCRSTFTGHKDFVLSVAFSPDGNWLISGSKDRTVQFWDPKSSMTHLMLQGHKNSVISVAVSPSGKHFATGSGDFRARCWKYDNNN